MREEGEEGEEERGEEEKGEEDKSCYKVTDTSLPLS